MTKAYNMSDRDIREMKESIDALVKAMNNGGVVKLKPQSWWFSLVSMSLGAALGFLASLTAFGGRVSDLETAVNSRMLDRWTGTMQMHYNSELERENRALGLRVPDVAVIKGQVKTAQQAN
jgi:hypothetical protein